MTNLLFIYGFTNLLPSISIATKAVALPLSAFFCKWSLLKIRKNFNFKQIMALGGILVAVTITFLQALMNDVENEDGDVEKVEKQEQITGLIMLFFSAIFQAFEVCLENRLFMIEPDLKPLAMQQAISSWKMILVLLLWIVSNLFSDTFGEKIGSNSEQFTLFFANMNEETALYWMMLGLMFVNALQANLRMTIVKDENAVFTQSTMMFSIPLMWVYHV